MSTATDKKKLEELLRARANLNTQIVVLRRKMGLPSHSRERATLLRDTLANLLKKKPLHYMDLVRQVRKRSGLQKVLYGSIQYALNTDDRFKSVSRGVWGLRNSKKSRS